jgi:hypothetical protein
MLTSGKTCWHVGKLWQNSPAPTRAYNLLWITLLLLIAELKIRKQPEGDSIHLQETAFHAEIARYRVAVWDDLELCCAGAGDKCTEAANGKRSRAEIYGVEWLLP